MWGISKNDQNIYNKQEIPHVDQYKHLGINT